MHYRRSAAAIASAVLLTGAGLGLTGTASAASSTSPQATAPTGVLAQLVVRAPNEHAFTRTSSGTSSWVDLGCKFLSTPSVAYSSASHTLYYVGVGTDRELWIRTSHTAGWQHLVQGANACGYSPSIKTYDSYLSVACTGAHSARTYVGTVQLAANGATPSIPVLVNEGGKSLSGPTLTEARGRLLLSVISTPNSIGNIYTKFAAQTQAAFGRARGYCSAQIGETNDLHFLACQNGNTSVNGGNAYSLYYTYGPNIGVSGQMKGSAAAVANSTNSEGAFFVVATTGEVFFKNATQTEQGGWAPLGGNAYPGISATPLPQA